jgi:hypothetical protein
MTAGSWTARLAWTALRVLTIIGRPGTAPLIATGTSREIPGAPMSRAKSGDIVGVDLSGLPAVTALPADLWPGAGSNRRPSDFQDSGIAFILNRHRP